MKREPLEPLRRVDTPRALVICSPGKHTLELGAAVRASLSDIPLECELLELSSRTPAADIDRRWAEAQGIVIVAEAQPGNDPMLKALLERPGTDAAGRAYGLVLHGEDGAVSRARSELTGRLDAIGAIDAEAQARYDHFVGCAPAEGRPEPLPPEASMHDEVRQVAHAVVNAVLEMRAGRLTAPDLLLARASG